LSIYDNDITHVSFGSRLPQNVCNKYVESFNIHTSVIIVKVQKKAHTEYKTLVCKQGTQWLQGLVDGCESGEFSKL
jgi:hypothetical protein